MNIKEQLEEIIKKNLPEKKEKVYRSDGKTELFITSNFHFNQALSQIDTSLIADEVLKVAVDRIKEYKNKECKESVIDGIKYGLINGEKICDDIISNLSPNKENKNNG